LIAIRGRGDPSRCDQKSRLASMPAGSDGPGSGSDCVNRDQHPGPFYVSLVTVATTNSFH
jgi:hypothetical protein